MYYMLIVNTAIYKPLLIAVSFRARYVLLYIHCQAWYPWYLVPRVRARVEPTKSSKECHVVPDKLQARQPTHLYDVIRDPRPFVARQKACAQSDLNVMMGLVVAKTTPAMWQHTRAQQCPYPLRIAYVLHSV